MNQANPTTDSGASSIQERLVNFLEPQEAPAPETEVVEDAPVDEVEEEVEDDAVEEDAAEDTGEAQLSTEDFAQLLGLDSDKVDVDENGNVVIRSKVDGVEKVATFKDILSDYQKIQHADNNLREVSEQKKAFQAQQAEAQKAYEEKLNNLDVMINYHKQQVLGKYQQYTQEKLNELRQYDPAEYAAVIQDYNRDMAQLNNAVQHAQSQRGTLTDEQQKAKDELLAKEAEKVTTMIPGWNEPDKADAEKKAIIEWASADMVKWGEDPSALKNINKGWLVNVLRNAMLHEKQASKNPTIENRVRKAPKLVRAGGTTPKATVESAKIKQLHKNIKDAGGKKGTVAKWLLAAGKV